MRTYVQPVWPSPLTQFVDKAGQHGFQIGIGGVLSEMGRQFGIDLLDRLGVFSGCDGPRAPRMQRVPRRTLVRSGRGGIAMLAEAVKDAGFAVPDWPEQLDEIVLGGCLPAALHHERAELEIR